MPPPNPLVSVVIPVFGRQQDLLRAIASVDAQDLDAYEIIVVDDFSDPPIELDQRPNLTILRHERNRGAAAARNSAVARARGRYVAFLDSDDIWQQGKISAQVRLLEDGADDCIGAFAAFAHEGRQRRVFNRSLVCDDWLDYFLKGCRVAPGSTMVVRRDLFERIGPQDEMLHRYEDWDWLLRAAGRYSFVGSTGPGAVLGRSRRPRAERVLKDLEHMADKWLPRLTSLQRRRFRAAIALEAAAAWRWEGQYARFAWNLTRACLLSPATAAQNLIWRFKG